LSSSCDQSLEMMALIIFGEWIALFWSDRWFRVYLHRCLDVIRHFVVYCWKTLRLCKHRMLHNLLNHPNVYIYWLRKWSQTLLNGDLTWWVQSWTNLKIVLYQQWRYLFEDGRNQRKILLFWFSFRKPIAKFSFPLLQGSHEMKTFV
jgi:hypothetical protein